MAIKVKNMIPEDDPRVSQIGHPAPPWMVNYADLMTEMVCFFIILYALSAALNKNVQNAAQQVKEMMEKGEMAGQVEINKEGLKITLEEQGNMPFFESGKADLTQEIIDNIEKLVPTLKKLSEDYEIIVEGHTDNVPIYTQQFASNWELSTARATAVVRYLVEKGIKPQKVSAIGYGEFRPVANNDTPENRQKNRRVVFFVKTTTGKVKNEKT
jgi:chemotaxis protein MotB